MMLRDYQQEMKRRLYEKWESGVRSVMLQMPTGTGKTHLMAAVIREHAGEGVLIVAHQIELIEQISDTLQAFGVKHGLVVNGRKALPEESVQVASIQTFSKRIGDFSFVPSFVIVDEAHHAPAKTYKMLWQRWPAARFLGLTATPCRLNGQAFTDLFDTLVQSWSIEKFIEQGWLSDFEYISADPSGHVMEQVRTLSKRGADGDYQTKEMSTVLDCPESIRHLYRTYRGFAAGKKGIVYAIDRAHARHISEYYREQGVSCCVIDARTPASERRQTVEDYRAGKITLMVNVDIFSEGWDVPEVEVIQLARPTLSLSKYLQQVGRGMRVSKGKSYVTVLDQVGLYQTFGMPADNRNWELLFRGRQAGKGGQTDVRPVFLRDEPEDKALLNLEMVRIKRIAEKRQGVEIFISDGKYGIAVDGKITCSPQFSKVERLPEPYFALCHYPYNNVFRGKVTVVDGKGNDLRPELYGRVRCDGDFFEGTNIMGSPKFWDSRTHKSYDRKPEVGFLGDMELLKLEQSYTFRFREKGMEFSFKKNDVRVSSNGRIIIIGKKLILLDGKHHTLYDFIGFNKGMMFVKVPGRNRYHLMMDTGKVYCSYDTPNQTPLSREPDRMYVRFNKWGGF